MLFFLRLDVFRKRSEVSTDCGSLALSVLNDCRGQPHKGGRVYRLSLSVAQGCESEKFLFDFCYLADFVVGFGGIVLH